MTPERPSGLRTIRGEGPYVQGISTRRRSRGVAISSISATPFASACVGDRRGVLRDAALSPHAVRTSLAGQTHGVGAPVPWDP